MSAQKGKDYPSNDYRDIAVGVAETGSGTPGGSGTQKIRYVVSGGMSGIPLSRTWYALFFDRQFVGYNKSSNLYTYSDRFYEKKIGTTSGSGIDTPPGAQSINGNIRYIPPKGSPKIFLGNKATQYSVSRPTTVQISNSPLSFNWSPKKGAGRWEDPYAVIPENSKEATSGGGGTGDGSGGSGDGGTDDGGSPDDVKIPGFGKKRKTFWNAPLISYAAGSYIPVGNEFSADLTAPGGRGDILGSGKYPQRITRKGFFRQYIVNPNDWRAGDYTSTDDEGSDGSETGASSADAMVEPGKRYAFRFHYNPATINFSVGYNAEVNPALIISSKTRAMPITTPEGGGPSLGLELYLNRIQDISMIRKKGKEYVISNTMANAYTKNVTREDLEQIATKGTMYDIEQLLLVCLGRKFDTEFRQVTSDIGFIFGVPLECHLSQKMRYRGRISSIQYTHTSFTPDMIPMFTTLNVTFDRYPDAKTFGGSSEKPGKDKPGKDKPPPNERRPRRRR